MIRLLEDSASVVCMLPQQLEILGPMSREDNHVGPMLQQFLILSRVCDPAKRRQFSYHPSNEGIHISACIFRLRILPDCLANILLTAITSHTGTICIAPMFQRVPTLTGIHTHWIARSPGVHTPLLSLDGVFELNRFRFPRWLYRSDMGIIKALVAAGCDTQSRNVAGRTPIDAATMRGHTGLVDYLTRRVSVVGTSRIEDLLSEVELAPLDIREEMRSMVSRRVAGPRPSFKLFEAC